MTAPETAPGTAQAPNVRRELTAAVVLCAAGGALALSAGGQTWAEVAVTRQAPLPPVAAVLTGGTIAPLVPACGLLLLAAAVAVFALRGWGRTVLGVLVAAAGAAVAVAAVRGLTGSVDVDTGDLGSQVGLGGAQVDVHVVAGWPVLALVAGVLGLAGGVLVTLRGRGWPGMGQRYQRAGAARPVRPGRPESPEDRHQAAWKALDGGTDPTEDDGGAR
ncbi:Trp biosynthesis-associated membrane protein [Klenkia terrae]|uniref:Trp biosynthesis-associated membrane protein n=1 Tax=Klenkia terrae TaxID=1052259 RepID=A0ABU8E4C0_9ACTN|nr:Trp biosynthesis-associated membrane protein [Klenkia terrae]